MSDTPRSTLAEAKNLYQVGAAVHWLYPQSKIPLDKGWQKTRRKTFADLKRQYHEGMNVGIKLGQLSQINRNGQHYYLGVIDFDIKTTEEKEKKKAFKELHRLFPDLDVKKPEVFTGRQGGSGHYYFLSRKPLPSHTLAKSSEKVAVKTGSLGHNKSLAAWEISLMSVGRQVVCPPSIHPDTGKQYKWRNGGIKPDRLPIVDEKDLPGSARAEVDQTPGAGGDFDPDIDPVLENKIPQRLLDTILDGDDHNSDRSAVLFITAQELVKLGYTDRQIAGLLSDRDTYLGAACYEHAGDTKSRARACKWLHKYTLKKARQEADAALSFAGVEVEDVRLSSADATRQATELIGEKDWKQSLERKGGGSKGMPGRPKATLRNIILILENAIGKNVFALNQLDGMEVHAMDTPWGGQKGGEVSDYHLVAIKLWLAGTWRMDPEPPTGLVNEALGNIASRNTYHPIREYLLGLEWDGVPRIDTWLKDFLGAEALEPYLTQVSRKLLAAMVARVMRPGCKFDFVVILQGEQGIGKSTVLRALAGDEWFSDAHINIGDKDAILVARGNWIVELGELSGMRKAEENAFKEFISRRIDRIRRPYGKRVETIPRQMVFVGTTNSEEYLKDMTGNRRFWPISVGHCDVDAVAKVRDQLFAEAMDAYMFGENLYLDGDAALEAAKKEQQGRTFSDDPLDEEIWDIVSRDEISDFLMSDLFKLLSVPNTKPNQMRVGNSLKRLGFSKKLSRQGNRIAKIWTKKEVVTT